MDHTTLISVQDLADNFDKGQWQVFDCRFSLQDENAGRKAYDTAHIPGARYADMKQQLSAPHIPGETGRHPLPERSQWLERVEHWGIEPQTQVVLYDDVGGATAARMWWMLRWAGHERVAVLDGGWQAWQAAGLPESDEEPAPPTPAKESHEALPALAKLVEVAGIDLQNQCLLDARDEARYRGEAEPIDPVAGHIPGALCLPYSGNLDGDGQFRDRASLQQRFAVLPGGRPVVCYCGSGVTAAHNILAMVHAGLPEPILYAGSWSEWITDPDRPVTPGR